MSYLINFLGGMKRLPDGSVAIITSTVDVSNTTTETVLATASLPANFLIAGRTFDVTIRGYHTSVSGNVRFRMRWGGVSGTVLSDTGTFAVGSHTDKGFIYETLITCRTAGGSGTVFSQAEYHELVSNETREGTTTSTVTIDTTTAKDLVLTVEMSVANANNNFHATNGVFRVYG